MGVQKVSGANKGRTAWNKGKTAKEDTRILSGERNGMWGKRHTEETRRKMSESKTGEKSPQWKGGKTTTDGYCLIYSPGHPNKNCHGYVMEHRLIMEKHFGRYLYPYEIVHHVNGIKNDNRIKNLELLPNGANHLLYQKLDKLYQENQFLKKQLSNFLML